MAFHHMFNSDHGLENSPLQDVDYRKDAAWTWERLMAAWEPHDAHIRWMRDEMGDSDIPLALTECHFTFPGRNRCEVLSTWAAGVAYARLANVHERHGDRLKIATLADFCGTRWQVNAVMVPVPGGHSYLMPVAEIMALYRWHSGERAVRVTRVPDNLDVTASRTGDTVYLHVVNTHRRLSTLARLGIEGSTITGGRVFELAGDPEHEITDFRPGSIKPVEKPLPAGAAEWRFPPASVTAVELTIA